MTDERWRLDQRIFLEGDDSNGAGILCDTYRADICTCNRSAWHLVQRLKSGATLSELVAALRDRFSVREDDAMRDATALIGHLQSMGYVNVED
jgi:coenzyme PQQ synthesis protein D (PqqD)